MKIYWLNGDASYPNPKIPLPWAASLMLLIVLPLTFYLQSWNFALWVSFIVWAQYFVLGANAKTAKIILPSLPFGAAVGALWCISAVWLSGIISSVVGAQHSLYVSFALTNLIWVTFIVYACSWFNVFQQGTLAVFNGFTLQLAVYFTASTPFAEEFGNPYLAIGGSFLWTVLMSYFGWLLGWLNVVLTFPAAPSNSVVTSSKTTTS